METTNLQTSERIYGLDALRSIMMLLGIVIHGSLAYLATNYNLWPLRDSVNSILFDLTSGFIHSFRMPIFFVVSGFFCALLLYKKGPNTMLVNRFKRIVLPLLAFTLLIDPLEAFVFAYSGAKLIHTPSPVRVGWEAVMAGKFLPFYLGHLWFLYFLALYAVIAWLLIQAAQKAETYTITVRKLSSTVLQRFWLRTLCLGALYFLCLYWQQSPYLLTSFGWIVTPSVFITYLLFFGLGWIIYTTNSLSKLAYYPIFQVSAATFLFLAQCIIQWPLTPTALALKIALSALYTPLFVFGFLAFFLTYFNQYSARLSYLMDASYWVYIIHLPVIAFIVGLLFDYPLSAFLKFTITFSATSIICLVSYHYLVRGTFIGLFLNGKVHKQKKITPEKVVA
ncbi:acyltransferase family protein [Spirosoma aerolatum]|uniref:acyltransferase family protein n=1 Tax=Spirosoma aerolatum TaxID=1211326 RepID=UPI0009ADE061|nr:acyltransferase family protein [Spirosoma aerolatum]